MNISLLGASGSIGSQSLDIIKEYNLRLVSCSIGHDLVKGEKIIREFSPLLVCLREENVEFTKKFSDVRFCYGDEGLLEIASFKADILINALMGSVGLKPTVKAIESKIDVALANKETLVMAGDIIMDLAKKNNVRILPIDSEHSAIWQCLKGENYKDIKNIIITASGGSFRDKNRTQLENVTVEDALNHPNWQMGRKITIDSATMMNKGLEVIEAHHLFNVDYDHIKTILHYESIIHSLVEFKDSSIKAQLATQDMRLPILYALNKEERVDYSNPLKLIDLHFREMDFNRFPCLCFAYQVGKMGGIAPTIMNAANEAAVTLFLNGKIKFLDIEKIIEKEIALIKNYTPTIDDIIKEDKRIKNKYLGGCL